MKENFDTDVVTTWSKRTRDAWNNNKKFSKHDGSEVRRIRKEICESLVDQLFQIHGIVTAPLKGHVREILRDVHQVESLNIHTLVFNSRCFD